MAKMSQQKQKGKYRGFGYGLTSGFIKYRRNTLCHYAKIHSLISLLQCIPFPFVKIGALK